MSLKRCKKIIAMILAVVLTICGLDIPAVSIYAGETEPPAVTSGVVSDDGTTLTFGDRSGLEGGVIERGLEITNEAELGFLKGMGVLNMTMLVRFDDSTANQNYALYTMVKGSDYFTLYYNPNYNRFGFSMSNNHGYFSESQWHLSDSGYHKISFMVHSNSKVSMKVDNQALLPKEWGTNFSSIINLINDRDAVNTTSARIGKRAVELENQPDQPVELEGDIKYVKFSKSTTQTDNSEIDAALSNSFINYVAECEALNQADYTIDTWTTFSAALTNALAVKTAPTEWGIHNTYAPLKAARTALVERKSNEAPVAIADVSRTLVSGRTLMVYGRDLATDEDGDPLTVKELVEVSDGSALTAAVENGALKIERGGGTNRFSLCSYNNYLYSFRW